MIKIYINKRKIISAIKFSLCFQIFSNKWKQTCWSLMYQLSSAGGKALLATHRALNTSPSRYSREVGGEGGWRPTTLITGPTERWASPGPPPPSGGSAGGGEGLIANFFQRINTDNFFFHSIYANKNICFCKR